MSVTYVMEDTANARGVYSNGTFIKLGKLGHSAHSANTQGHVPKGGPYYPNILNRDAIVSGTSGGSSPYTPLIKASGTFSTVSWFLPITDSVAAGDWIFNLTFPIQVPDTGNLVLAEICGGVCASIGGVWQILTGYPQIFTHSPSLNLNQLATTVANYTITAASPLLLPTANSETDWAVYVTLAITNPSAFARVLTITSTGTIVIPDEYVPPSGLSYTLGQQGGVHGYVSG